MAVSVFFISYSFAAAGYVNDILPFHVFTRGSTVNATNVYDYSATDGNKDDPNFSFQTIEIYDGIKATYIAGPTSEKLFWNDNGFQYMIGDNSKNGKSDFYGPTKLAETALSFQ
ncbi:hypothetical protein RCG24_06175 [Neobacillus sp. OS1-32]|jgi:hypothetical protein|uniref:hypothetical protein n=1 Tax=Neobacillus sp. OS1-32 TaxID=3070682 RepID=UPI0027DFE0F3|nr:hypothetical protein [Neobacillus sp. OS1-32]WML31449.1 hypothetical protein RCG24_06175 [Neobacillus sp. OS1-32]